MGILVINLELFKLILTLVGILGLVLIEQDMWSFVPSLLLNWMLDCLT